MADKTKTININGNPYTVGEENMCCFNFLLKILP